MAKAAVTTVTHPDNTVSKRSSVRATYTHAVVVGPVDPAVRAAFLRQQAMEAFDEADRIAKVLAGDVVVRIRDRGFRLGDPSSYHSHEAYLVGLTTSYSGRNGGTYPTFQTHCDSIGMVENYAHDAETGDMICDAAGEYIKFEQSAKPALIEVARQRQAERFNQAVKYQDEAQAADRGDRGPKGNTYSVVRWSTRHDLAAKAADGEFSHYSVRGHEVSVVEVDAK